MLTAAGSDQRGGGGGRTPLVVSTANGGGKGSSWQIAGVSIDYALDWALVLVLTIVLAASEAGVPRQGEHLRVLACSLRRLRARHAPHHRTSRTPAC